MELDPRTKPEATALSGMTVAEICVDVARKAAITCGLDADVTENVLTWAIDIEPEHFLLFVADDELRRRYLQDPHSVALCGETAKNLFRRLTTTEGVAGVFEKLAPEVGRTGTDPERAAFHVRFSNHEFIIVVRNGIAEVLQSFQGEYSLGRCLQRSKPYAPECLQQHLGDIASPHVQQLLFYYSPLDKEDRRAEYTKAYLKPDEEIWRILFQHAILSLDLYRSHRSGLQQIAR